MLSLEECTKRGDDMLETESVIGLGCSSHKGFDLLGLERPDNRWTLVELQETKKRTEPVLVSFDGPFRQSARIAQVGTEEFEFSFGVRHRFPPFLSQELSLAEETTNRADSARHIRFPVMKVNISRIQLWLVQPDKTLMAALQ
ncbi:MAG: hypothetical protein WCC08_06480 [Terrimicrobiaceae bacterium]